MPDEVSPVTPKVVAADVYRCPRCTATIEPTDTTCPRCGAVLQPIAVKIPAGTSDRTPARSTTSGFQVPTRGAGPSAGGVVAVLFAIVIALLLVIMATGFNQQIPYLHPTAGNSVTLVGDREVYDFLYVSNGTYQNVTVSHLCDKCPMGLATGSSFVYVIPLQNTLNRSFELTSVGSNPPFSGSDVQPKLPFYLAGGLSDSVTLTDVAPSGPGTYVLVVTLGISVQ